MGKLMEYGRYQVVDELGKGTMGVVYKAHDPHIDRAVALKVLRRDRVTSDEFVQRFLTEAKAIGRLNHPGIVMVYDVGQDDDVIYIAEEFLEGKPLNQIMREDRLSFEQVADIGVQVAEAMDYAHEKGIIHRDIKPPNIIVSPDGRVKITDFGIARIEDPDMARLTRAGVILGTPMYMSPEQVAGEQLDGRSDLYSLGVILYQLSTRKRPSWGTNLGEIFKSILDDIPPEPKKIDPSVPGPLSALIMKSLEKTPDHRFQTGKEMVAALKSCLSGEKPGETVHAPHESEERKSGRLVQFLIAALIVACLAGVGIVYYPRSENREASPAPPVNHAVVVEEPEASDMAAARGTLTLKSDPSGARIFLNGALEGKTPMNITLPLGKHHIRLKLRNHLEAERLVELDQEEETIFLKLDPL
ncbi:MAG: protein kinase [Desulfobacterales bacterium]|nr:protein kinase [Desulfobacterales bacterium]